MALIIMLLGMLFNCVNALMQGGWLFYKSPDDYYTIDWLTTPQFIIGTIIFFVGMIINIHSDNIIRNLRKMEIRNIIFQRAVCLNMLHLPIISGNWWNG